MNHFNCLFSFLSSTKVDQEDPSTNPAESSSTKIYADLDAVQNAVVSSSLSSVADFNAEVLMTSESAAEAAGASLASASATYMQWEYLDANTVRTYEIPVHVGSENYPGLDPGSLSLPQGFTPMQQFPGSVATGSSGSLAPPPPPPPSTGSSGIGENQSILIQRVPHRNRRGKGKINFQNSVGIF